MAQVETSRGLIDRELLVWRDVTTEDDNQITTVRSWYLRETDGVEVFVRNSVWIDVLRGLGTDIAGGCPNS